MTAAEQDETSELEHRPKPMLEENSVPVNRKSFQVALSPGTGITLVMETKRFANQLPYAYPWHGDGIPICQAAFGGP